MTTAEILTELEKNLTTREQLLTERERRLESRVSFSTFARMAAARQMALAAARYKVQTQMGNQAGYNDRVIENVWAGRLGEIQTIHMWGGPGAGPVGVKKVLEPYLPVPRVVKKGGTFGLDFNRPKSIGRVRSFYGNFLVLVKALAYMLSLGPAGLREMSEIAVLNANYIRKSLEKDYHLKYTTPTLHECVFSDKIQKDKHGISNLDIAKRLIDLGFHPPTMSFPLIVHGALMIEPTETESRRDLDGFIAAMIRIAREAETEPETLKSAPHHSTVRRLDETLAARNPVLKWEKPKA